MNERVLLVDLNNFARYPTLPIGYLAAVLRQESMQVNVFAPLMIGVKGTTREKRPGKFGKLKATINYQFASSRKSWVRSLRNRAARARHSEITQHQEQVLQGFREACTRHTPEVVMISTYLMYLDVCREICLYCVKQGIKVIIGGPYFVQPEVYREWVHLEGLDGIVAGELELEAPGLVRTLLSNGDLTLHSGVLTAENGEIRGHIARPLRNLDKVPFPDFTDFPWHLYPNRIVPVITGRGCAWGACSFCSDVISTAGRTYRSRSPDNVLAEIAHQFKQYGVRHFVFTDLKLNSEPAVWLAIIDQMQTVAPGSTWIASVHVGNDAEQTLSADLLKRAAESGCVRLTTGLESGSQKVLDSMKKGTHLQNVSQFLKHAADAGISCRVTMITGYPGEVPDDLEDSRQFLESHSGSIERVMLNRLLLMSGTPLVRSLKKNPEKHEDFKIIRENGAYANLDHEFRTAGEKGHRRAMKKLLGAVVSINNQPLRASASSFEGVM